MTALPGVAAWEAAVTETEAAMAPAAATVATAATAVVRV
jgi:hypothetical protein